MTAVWYLLVGVAAVALCQQEKRETACGPPDSLQVPLSCPPSQWIHVMSEQYSKAPADGSCALGSACRRSLSSFKAGLDVSCNGVVGASGVCQEPTAALHWLDGCLNGSERAAVQVRYECISGNDVIEMCSNGTQTWTPIFDGMLLTAYLATLNFPHTPALSQHCTCNITGQNLWMLGLEVKADVGRSAPWLDVLTIVANNTEQWSMQHSGGGHVRYLQEAMLVPNEGQPFVDASVNYQDYNLPGQLAWIRVQGGGSNLTITCDSVSVPPPPTTTTTTTTTPATTPTTTTTTPTTTPTTRPLSSQHSPISTGSTSGTGNGGGGRSSMAIIHTAPSTAGTTSVVLPSVAETDSTDNEDTGVIVGLCVLLILLIAIAIVLGFIIWRRYQRAKKGGQLEEGGGGFGAFLGLHYWYNRQRHRRQDNDPALVDIPVSDFHNLEGIGQEVEGHDMGQYETIGDLDLRLQAEPSGGKVGVGRGEKQEKDNHAQVGGGGHHGSVQKHPAGQERCSHSASTTPSLSSSLPAMEAGSRSLLGTGGQRGLTGKQEEFVTRVLDQTLESIASQREALTADVTSPEQPPSSRALSGGMAAASERSATSQDPAAPYSDLDLTNRRGVIQNGHRQHPKDTGSAGVDGEKEGGEKGVGHDDVYTKPVKRSPPPKENGKKEISDGRGGDGGGEDNSGGAIPAWTADVESSV